MLFTLAAALFSRQEWRTIAMLAQSLLDEFKQHVDRMRQAARERRESVRFVNCVEDNRERGVVVADDMLGKAHPSDKFAGDTNLRTLRTLLAKIDDRGYERSNHQLVFHDAFERCVSRVIYK